MRITDWYSQKEKKEMERFVEIRGIRIGEGMPKICIPIVERTKEAILGAAWKLKEEKPDVIEWRADWFDEVFEDTETIEVLKALRGILEETVLLFTFRSKKEGGEKEITEEAYTELNLKVAGTGLADIIDVELFAGEMCGKRIIEGAHAAGVKVIVSSHDFAKTPETDELISRLCRMQVMGADIPKIAVMPRNAGDVLTLLEVTYMMRKEYAKGPVITISMSGEGLVSRLCGEVFGSALTFAAAGKTSAPGQIEASQMRELLQVVHENLR